MLLITFIDPFLMGSKRTDPMTLAPPLVEMLVQSAMGLQQGTLCSLVIV